MNKNRPFIAFLLTFLIVMAVTFSQKPASATAEVLSQEGTTNHVYIDVTYDPNGKTYSIGGFTEAQLRQLGAPALQDELWGMVGMLGDLNLKMDGEQLNVKVNDTNLATLDWDDNSRAFVYDLMDSYGQMQLIDRERMEDWLGKAQIELSLRKSAEVSQPLVIDLATLLNVDVANDGRVSVEGFNTGTQLTPEVLALLDMGSLQNAAVCWNQGKLVTALNGKALPQLTLYPEGLNVVDKAFSLNLGDLSQLFLARFGASVLVGEGDHTTIICEP